MRTKQIAVIMVLSLFTVLAFGQTNTTPSETPDIKQEANDLFLVIIPLLVPIVVSVLKVILKFLPSWSLPIIAAGLGELGNVISGLLGGPTTSVVGGVLLGSAGVGIREILNELKKRATTPS